jgi:hypothetical protein
MSDEAKPGTGLRKLKSFTPESLLPLMLFFNDLLAQEKLISASGLYRYCLLVSF